MDVLQLRIFIINPIYLKHAVVLLKIELTLPLYLRTLARLRNVNPTFDEFDDNRYHEIKNIYHVCGAPYYGYGIFAF